MTLARERRDAFALLLLRVLVGWVFFAEGVQKFLYPEALGVGRFEKIGIWIPQFSAPFVGVVEIACGALLMAGLATVWASIPLLIDIATAIATTKIPMMEKAGFWPAMHEARTDFCMLLGLIAILVAGPGAVAFDSWRKHGGSR